MIRVFIVDDHPAIIRGVAAALMQEQDLEVVGSAPSAAHLLTAVERLRPDVVLLDLELPGVSGIEAIGELLRNSPDTRVLAFTGHSAAEYVCGAVRAGASGCVLKGADVDEIARAIRTVHSGEAYAVAPVAAMLVAEPCGAEPASNPWSDRERAVLRLVAAGASDKQIARSLAIAERTVKFRIASIRNRLGAANRAQAAAIAIRSGLIPT